MQDIRIDANGDQRCWNCGGKNCFTLKRTAKSKVRRVLRSAIPGDESFDPRRARGCRMPATLVAKSEIPVQWGVRIEVGRNYRWIAAASLGGYWGLDYVE